MNWQNNKTAFIIVITLDTVNLSEEYEYDTFSIAI
jgi:hypothetical protein